MMAEVPKATFNNGNQMPMIGVGTYARKAEPGQFKQAVEWAIEAGYRHIDGAAMYKNEKDVGQAIANKIKEGLVKREDLFITTKLLNDKHAEKDVVPSLKQSLEDLQLDYVDLFLIHWPISRSEDGKDMAIDYIETWKGMEKTVELGLTKSIGVSNFNEEQLGRVLENGKIKPVVNQIEECSKFQQINPTLTQHKIVDYCKEKSIIPVAYTPLGLISEARPEFAGKDVIKTDAKLGKIAEKYGKSRAQVALRYLTQRGIPVLPKSFTKSRIEENLNIFDFELNKEEMDVVDSYNLDHRCVPGRGFEHFTYYPY